MTRILLILLLSLTAFGQPSPINRRAFALAGLATTPTIPTPPQISPGMYRWWVSQDVSNNVVVSNQWTDRIVGDHMWQMDLTVAPTNGPAGVRYNGTQFSTNSESNSGITVGNIGAVPGEVDSFYLIFTPDGAAGEEQICTDITLSNYGPGMNGSNFRYTGTISGGPATIAPLVAGSTNDVLMVLTSTNTYWYTNGVAAKTNATASVDVFGFKRMGKGGQGFYKGSVFECGMWSNVFFDLTLAGKVHKYATNLYKYSP